MRVRRLCVLDRSGENVPRVDAVEEGSRACIRSGAVSRHKPPSPVLRTDQTRPLCDQHAGALSPAGTGTVTTVLILNPALAVSTRSLGSKLLREIPEILSRDLGGIAQEGYTCLYLRK